MKYALITGSNGLVGSEAVDFFIKKKFKIIAIDNNFRKYFFGKNADTTWQKPGKLLVGNIHLLKYLNQFMIFGIINLKELA